MSTLIPTGMDSSSGQFKISQPTDILSVPTAIISSSSTPTLALGAAAGSGATSSVAGSNIAGKITLNSGTGILVSGTVMTMTFANSLSYPTGCFISFSAGNAAFATVIALISVSTTQTTVVLSVSAALSISTTYIGYYHIIGY